MMERVAHSFPFTRSTESKRIIREKHAKQANVKEKSFDKVFIKIHASQLISDVIS